MAKITTTAQMKSFLQSKFPAYTNIDYMTATYATETQLYRRYAFNTGWILKCYLLMMWCTGDTYYAGMAKQVIDRILSRRDDRSDVLGEYDGTDGYLGGGPHYFSSAGDGANTAGPFGHRDEGGGWRALILDNGIVCTMIMMFVDIVKRYPVTFAAYLSDIETYMDDVQETYDAWHGVGNYATGNSSWRDDHTPSEQSVVIEGAYYWDRWSGSLDDSSRPEWNQQCQFIIGQLLLYKYRPNDSTNSDTPNKVNALLDYWKKRIVLYGSGATENYSWPYSHTNLTQAPGCAGGQSDETNKTAIDSAYGSFTFSPEDLGHAVLTIELVYHAFDAGMSSITQTDVDRFIQTFLTAMDNGDGTISTIVRSGGSTTCADAQDYGAGSWCLLKDEDSNIAARMRAIIDNEHPDQEASIDFHKEYYAMASVIYAETANPPEETAGNKSPILLLGS